MAQRYQVKLRGQVVGEFSLEEIQTQQSRGQLGPFHKFSSDGVNWCYFNQLNGVSAPQEGAAIAESASNVVAESASNVVAESASNVVAGSASSVGPESANHAAPVPTGGVAEPQPVATVRWFLAIDERQFGPFDAQEVEDFIRDDRLVAGHQIWREGFDGWKPAEDFFGYSIRRAAKRRKREEKKAVRAARLAAIPEEEREYSILALASLGLAAVWGFGLTSIAALVLSILALMDILSSRGYRKGLVQAIIGLVLSIAGIIVGLIVASQYLFE